MHDVLARETGQVLSNVGRPAAFDPGITTVKFGPSFLEQHHPQFSLSCVTWNRKTNGVAGVLWLKFTVVCVSRELIINNNSLLAIVDEEGHTIDTSIILFLVDEPSLNPLWLLSERRQACHEVAVA